MKPQVEKLIIGNAVAGETNVTAFIASASDKEIKVLSADGSAPAAGKDFKIYQKTANGVEFSDLVKADKVQLVKVVTYAPEVQKEVKVTGFTGNVVANTTYTVEVRIYNPGGSLSNENYDIVSGYHVTGSNVTNVTAADIRNGLLASINANLKLRGDNEVLVAADGADLTITGRVQKVVPGKMEGRQIKFDVVAKQFNNASLYTENLGLLTTSVTTDPVPGKGTGKYAVNLEWFTKGYDNEVYRETSYPANFDTTYYASLTGIYNVIHLFYFDDRASSSVETQEKLITILVDKGTDTNPNNAETNKVLADLRTILGATNVPAALSVSA